MQYRIVRIPKGRGRFREIHIPSPPDMLRLRHLIPRLEEILAENDSSKVNYAFERGKNCALNATQHVGYRYTLSMDLEDFFDSVSEAHVKGIIPDEIVGQCMIGGSPRQGLPTSPLIATLAFLPCDSEILQRLQELEINAVYTRYADDLVFSFNDRRSAGKIRVVVRQVTDKFGFRINSRKTSLQDAKNGRRIITGIAVDAMGIHPTRRTMKKIRAAAHQQREMSMLGLVEWSRCKLPANEQGAKDA